jgi:hypothetical protein
VSCVQRVQRKLCPWGQGQKKTEQDVFNTGHEHVALQPCSPLGPFQSRVFIHTRHHQASNGSPPTQRLPCFAVSSRMDRVSDQSMACDIQEKGDEFLFPDRLGGGCWVFLAREIDHSTPPHRLGLCPRSFCRAGLSVSRRFRMSMALSLAPCVINTHSLRPSLPPSLPSPLGLRDQSSLFGRFGTRTASAQDWSFLMRGGLKFLRHPYSIPQIRHSIAIPPIS